ncbi:DUF721 domain-containing protein [Ruficoccus sp. ZRK36]|uniref:DUF721 domain-containing protein n=1 Tax=Ruficoccus sp. ZRK36 TaxID=2866311 RepID=UPI001C737CA9|nr:DUF721 domain-containing protein [Ruficoccus sp. ZRK36]QYY37384.1 DUF721 domain-containing protein [Ruficoccus sp. ZRK36]
MHFRPDIEDLIASLRGIPGSRSRAKMRRTTSLDNLVEVLLERHQIGQDNIEDVIMQHWKEIVGERTAHRCRPQRIANGRKLIILAGSPVIRQELQFNQHRILRQIHRLPGCHTINEIAILNG